MKLTDIDLSSLAEVAAAVTLLEHVHRELATGGTPLPSLPPAQEIVVNPAMYLPPTQGSGETMMTPFARQQAAPTAVPFPAAGLGTKAMDAEARRVEPMDAASVFGGAPAQSAAPLPPAPSTAGVAASPTAPAEPPASGALPTLPALAPLPAPSAAAPTAPAAPPSPAGGVELDTDGLPWDARIHAGTKRRNADGRWTAKKGINDPDLVPRVVAQLRAQIAAGGITTTAPAPHVKAEPVDALKTLATLPPAPAIMPTLPEQPALPANPASTLAALQAAMTPASAAPAPTTFQDFMTALTVEVQSGRVPIEALGAACQPLGGVSALNAKPELIPVAWASLKAKYPGML